MRHLIGQVIITVCVVTAPLSVAVLAWKKQYKAALTYLALISLGPLAMYGVAQVQGRFSVWWIVPVGILLCVSLFSTFPLLARAWESLTK